MNDIKKNKIRSIDLMMILLVTTFGALFFLCITRSIEGIALFNPWISAMICAAIFETVLILFAITVSIKKVIVPIVIIAFLPSIIFVPVVWHIIVVVVAMLIAIKGLYIMRHTLFNSLKIDVGTIVKSGVAYVSFALIIAITSQYYFFVKQNTDIIFDASNYVKSSNLILDYILKSSNVGDVSINTMTVDDFVDFMIEQVYKQKEAQGPQFSTEDEGIVVRLANQSGVNIETIEQNVENQASEQLFNSISEIIGRDVTGKELATDVFSEIISIKIDDTMTKNEFLRKNKATIFTIVFFLIIFSLASIVKIITGLITKFTFLILRESKIIKVSNTKRDAEVIIL